MLTDERVTCSALPLKLSEDISPSQYFSSKKITSLIYMIYLSVKSLGTRLLVCYPIVSRFDLVWIILTTMSLASRLFSIR